MARPPSSSGPTDRAHVAALGSLRELQSALKRDDRPAIVQIVRQLVKLRPRLGEQWVPLANIAAANGESTLARAAMEAYLEASASDPTSPCKKVVLLMTLGEWEEALALVRTLSPELPDPAAYAYSRGAAALYVGESEEARQYLETAIRARPETGSPWLALSGLVDFAREEHLMDQLVAAERLVERSSAVERVAYQYALGKALDDQGEHARAFAAFARGAEITKAHSRYRRETDASQAAEAIAGYESAAIEAIARQQTEPSGRAMFVTGLPRSGTTLVEQILTSHSAVGGGAEIYRLPLLAKDIGGASHQALLAYTQKSGASAAARLWAHLLDERFSSAGRVVDKSLDTSRFLGLAAALLPEAPLVWLTRDPLDCAWSCFRRRFFGEAEWSFDLEDIAFHFRLEDALLERWRNILGDRLLVVPYEALVSEPNAWISRILGHCGLAEEAMPYAPHENRRTVTTSSVMQVRQPINRRAIGAAEPYRAFLEPFGAAYYG